MKRQEVELECKAWGQGAKSNHEGDRNTCRDAIAFFIIYMLYMYVKILSCQKYLKTNLKFTVLLGQFYGIQVRGFTNV